MVSILQAASATSVLPSAYRLRHNHPDHRLERIYGMPS